MSKDRRSIKKILMGSFVTLAATAALCAAYLPTILSWDSVQVQFIAALNEQIPGHISVRKFSLSWHNGQKIEGFTLSDPKGHPVISFDTLTTDTPLLTILKEITLTGRTTIKNLNAAITQTGPGITNLDESLGRKALPLALPMNEKLSVQSLDANIQMSRDIVAKVTGKFQHDHLAGNFDAHFRLDAEALTLLEPLHVNLDVTPLLGRELLGKIAPVLQEIIKAENPISLTLSDKGFILPVHPFDINRIKMEKATVAFGKAYFSNAGDVRKLLSLLRAKETNQASVWATPLYLSMNHGLLQVKRMDILINGSYPMATWGTVDFAKDHVKMVLGVSAQALEHSLGISGLDKKMMLQLPITGSIAKAKLDSTKATARIASLIAQNKGGTHGMVLGAVIDLASGKDPKVPEPTTQPFPWQSEPLADIP